MKNRYKVLFPLAGTLLGSCEKEIDFKYLDIEPILVIEGALTGEGASVSLTMTTPMDEPTDLSQVKGASVTLTDLTAGTTVTLLPTTDNPDAPYRADTEGVVGHNYRLEVLLPGSTEPNTAECVMPPAAGTPELSLAWIKMPYDRVAVLQTRFEATTGQCYWVRVYRDGEAYMWRAVSESAVINGEVTEVFMTSRQDISEEEDDTVLVDGDELTVTVAPISRAMHDYLEAIGADSSGPRMFAGPMALGYFLAAPLSTATITFHPSEIPDF
ncbi:MAG: DUF4249 domain-containing protein [[Clostridium] fimetarium]|nr:DUF4249 domain-containing protein [Alistipes timonensis]MCM1406346.1 DUF4249 domain-containing protein [[Clostridium] fimetarium]